MLCRKQFNLCLCAERLTFTKPIISCGYVHSKRSVLHSKHQSIREIIDSLPQEMLRSLWDWSTSRSLWNWSTSKNETNSPKELEHKHIDIYIYTKEHKHIYIYICKFIFIHIFYLSSISQYTEKFRHIDTHGHLRHDNRRCSSTTNWGDKPDR